jgi:hypothetical protein
MVDVVHCSGLIPYGRQGVKKLAALKKDLLVPTQVSNMNLMLTTCGILKGEMI